MEATDNGYSQPPMFAIKYQQKIVARTEAKEQSQRYGRQSIQLKVESSISKINQKHRSIDVAQMKSARFKDNEKTSHNRRSQLSERDNTETNSKKDELQQINNKGKIKSVFKAQQLQKQYQKVPLGYSEQVGWSGVKGRLVYRGPIPRNSFYYMSNLKECDEEEHVGQNPKPFYENDLQFNSRFESGNLDAAIRIHRKQYWLFMREDTNTFGLRQWFFFEVFSNRCMNVTFRIYKFSKKHSLYRQGMKPYIKQVGMQWMQKGQNVGYSYDEQLKCYYLKFNYGFTKIREKIIVASMPPYTYSRLERLLEDISGFDQVNVRSIGKSLGGVDIPLIEIKQKLKGGRTDKDKKAIVILGRTHPAETCSNFSLETILNKILFNHQLKQTFDFFIIPMVNPDGVIMGNHRTSLTGVDLNRKFTVNFKGLDKDLFPEVQIVKDFIKQIHRKYKIELLLDLHGHSAKRNVFAYGQKEQLRSQKYLKGHIIPKLLDQHLSYFYYQYCLFQSYKEKQKTARVYFGKKYKLNALTFEQSYGFAEEQPIGIKEWKRFGEVLIDMLSIYTKKYMENNEEMVKVLQQQISEEEHRQNEESKKSLQSPELLQLAKQVKQVQQRKSQQASNVPKPELLQIQGKTQLNDREDQIQSQLDSGDEQLQNTQQNLEQMRRNLFPKPQYQQVRRKSLVLTDKTIELQDYTQPYTTILHQQKIPIISRIMKMREKRKESSNLIELLTQKTDKQGKKNIQERIRQYKIKLPNLERFLS